ncbi:hypothetical protein AMS68_002568 [Peltaster fructicola]|uniref:C2H2-type domain-containing protein n=1 Tax=Peltaster fructicola TaxID=286661 RepID=A0A6H0XQX4_9PEZI|nr:hypothetical protein AMS68_002568 [Peltaster fructicola]
MTSYQRPFVAQYDQYESSPDCGSPMPGYASHMIPDPSCPYYNKGNYRFNGLPPFVTAALPDASPFHMNYATSLHGHHLDNCSSSNYTLSERHDSPLGSDFVSTSPSFLSEYHYEEGWQPQGHNRTTSMSDVQNFADHTSEQCMHDPEPLLFYMPHDGYMTHDSYIPSEDATSSVAAQTPELTTTEQPTLRQRRPAARSSFSKPPTTHRINKRNTPKRSATLSTTSAVDSDVDEETIPPRPFHCPLAPYGCQSTFGSKNEWKRHFSTQHLRLEYWRCDKCPISQSKKPNDFNRRDLFTQHVRRMHSHMHNHSQRKARNKTMKSDDSEQQIAQAAARCHRRLRSPPSKSICVICRKAFSGVNSWEDRMEHLGRHFEGTKKENGEGELALDVESWARDTDVEQWMVEHGILSHKLELVAATDDHKD